MEMSQELTEKIQELQILERNMQAFSMEKQTLQVELNEIDNALLELNKNGDEVYKIINGIMIKSDKNSLSKEMSEKKKVLDLRISAIEKQENSNEQKTDKLRSEINASFETKKAK